MPRGKHMRVSRRPADAKPVEPNKMWEYLVMGDTSDSFLNALGKECWELCGVITNEYGNHKHYFKRPLTTKQKEV